jgi:imidazolonepropionase-like amidohydrolase
LAIYSPGAVATQTPGTVIAIVGATVIDGNGGRPLENATVVVRGEKIADVGPRTSVRIPQQAQIIDGRNKFVMPGLIDTNVHMAPISDELTYARYWDRLESLALQGLQLQLRYGLTTVRDTYGPLLPMMTVRDRIMRGELVGPRTYVGGNIVGWGGPYSQTMSGISEAHLTFFQERMNDFFTLGSGEELTAMTPEELRVAINKYLDRGVNFVKYGGSTEAGPPYLILFSPRAQQVIVEETHKRGLIAEAHAKGLEALRLSILAGIDLIQHPEAVGERELTDELVRLIIDRKIICSLLPNKYTGRIWERALASQTKAAATLDAARSDRKIPPTSAEIRRQVATTGRPNADTVYLEDLSTRRVNAKKLIDAGAIISIGADTLLFGRPGVAPEFLREDHPVPEHLEPGIGTIVAIEGLVELGMTPSQAIVAATKNGALACKAADQFGTLERGKMADLLVLSENPLTSISNIRKVEFVMKGGQMFDPKTLPTQRVTDQWRSGSSQLR